MKKFANRKEAGKKLAESLFHLKRFHPLIIALPKGGVPIAIEIAKKLQAEVGILISRKIGLPFHPEYAAGAVCENELPIWNANVLDEAELEASHLEGVVKRERQTISALKRSLRQDGAPPDVKGRWVVLVDDGLATGATMKAAISYVKSNGAKKITIALPVGYATSIKQIEPYVDEAIVLNMPSNFYAVGDYYKDFPGLKIEKIVRKLEKFHRHEQKNEQKNEVKIEKRDDRSHEVEHAS